MAEKLWAGVFFHADEGTLVVPSSWLITKGEEVLCWYPPVSFLPREITKAVDERDKPNKALGWRLLQCRVECKSSTRLRCERKLTALDKGRAVADTTDADAAEKQKTNLSLEEVRGSSSSTPKRSSKKTLKQIHKVNPPVISVTERKRKERSPLASTSMLNIKKSTGLSNGKVTSSSIANKFVINDAPSASEVMKRKTLGAKRKYGEQPLEHLFSDNEEDMRERVKDSNTDKKSDEAENVCASSSEDDSVSTSSDGDRETSKNEDSEMSGIVEPSDGNDIEEENEPPEPLSGNGASHSEEGNRKGPTDSKTCCPCSVACCPCAREERNINRRFRKRVSGLLSAIELYMFKKSPAMVSKPPAIPQVDFPMTTVEQVAALCSVLSSNNLSVKEKTIHHFSWYNDKLDIGRTVKAVTDALMTDDLVEKFNLCGKGMKNKVGLKKTFPEIMTLLFSIMRQDTEFTEKQLEQKLMVYFARVQERKKKKAKAAEEMAEEANPANDSN